MALQFVTESTETLMHPTLPWHSQHHLTVVETFWQASYSSQVVNLILQRKKWQLWWNYMYFQDKLRGYS